MYGRWLQADWHCYGAESGGFCGRDVELLEFTGSDWKPMAEVANGTHSHQAARATERLFYIQDSDTCTDCLGSFSPTWSVDPSIGWMQNYYTFEEQTKNGSAFVSNQRQYLVTQMTPSALPADAVVGAWADASWACYNTSGFCRRQIKLKESIVDPSHSEGKDHYQIMILNFNVKRLLLLYCKYFFASIL